jgi:hypothetical protein
MYFEEIRGMGFNIDGVLHVQAESNAASQGPAMDGDWPNMSILMDRATTKVWVQMTDALKVPTGPDEGGMGRIRLQNSENGIWSDWYVDRFVFQPEG